MCGFTMQNVENIIAYSLNESLSIFIMLTNSSKFFFINISSSPFATIPISF